MLVDAEFIEDVGLMCEEYFLYCEELDWVLRGKKRGWDIGYCSEIENLPQRGGEYRHHFWAFTQKQAFGILGS